MSPEKVIDRRVVGVTVSQVLYLLYKDSIRVGDSVLDIEEGWVNTRLLVPRVTFPEKVVAGYATEPRGTPIEQSFQLGLVEQSFHITCIDET